MNILVVEDDKFFRASISRELSFYGEVEQAGTLESAKEIILNKRPNVAFIDLNLTDSQDYEGLEIVKLCREQNISAFVLTGHESKEIIGKAYELGATHYFAKSDFQDNLHERVGGMLKGMITDHLSDFFDKEFITRDEKLISSLKYLIEQSQGANQPLLISGPTGVGKSKIAKYIHKLNSPKTPFVHINLSEIPETLLESELFGHKKGAFTGAIRDTAGILEKAHGGTLFLDEIGTIPLHVQKKLLRVIEEKTYSPVGGTEVKTSQFRLMTATCDDLGELISSGEFRVDFYFRIKGLEVNIPALKDRRMDIVPLLDSFIQKSHKKIFFDEVAEKLLRTYDWHGNVRELENLVHELINFGPGGLVRSENLPPHIQNNANPFEKSSNSSDSFLTSNMRDFISENGLPELIKEIEKAAMDDANSQYNGKTNEISRFLKISKSVFYRINQELRETNGMLQ